MAYIVYIDGVALPVTPSKMQLKVKNQNKSVNLINEGEVNILKDAGLTDISFEAMIPFVRYPFSFYPNGFKEPSFYISKLEKLKTGKVPFQFICSRKTASGQYLFDTNLKVSLEDYRIDEDSADGQSLTVVINLKQYKDYGTKVVTIQSAVATVTNTRPTETAPAVKTYTVKSGDTLWNISKQYLGNGSRYTEIYNLNKDKVKNPNLIYAGQVLTLPS
jgi:nucleoid-associated protein YgaU